MNNNEDRAVRKVVIDPGHGGTDSGATGNNLLEKDMKQIWKDSSVLNWIRGAEFIKCQRCGERCEFSCPLARKERKEEFICSFKQVMH